MQDPRDIFKRFSDNARHVLVAAQKIAETMGTGIGSEHILLALSVTSGNLAYEILRENLINIDQIRLIIRFNNIKSVHGQGLSQESRLILEKATDKAIKLKNSLVEPEHLLWAVLNNPECLGYKIISKIGADVENLKEQLDELLVGGAEIEELIDKHLDSMGEIPNQSQVGPHEFMFFGPTGPQAVPKTQTAGNKSITPTLDYFATDLTDAAKKNKLDPVIGRENEITRMIQILCRRTKNNPVLVGDPGIGKTAIVEGLAQKISSGQIPINLQGKRLVSLDLALVVSGTMYRGQFEERIKKIIEEITKAKNIILFLDEIHTMVGTGSAEGSMDTANILKPTLSKGLIRLIGATTSDEYRKHIEKDSALERRLQPIRVIEPSADESIKILEGIKHRYEEHHQIEITTDAIKAAVNLSKRYISDRFLPDKAIDLIDEAAAAVQIQNQLHKKNKKLLLLQGQLQKVLDGKEKEVEKQNYEAAARLKAQEIRIRLQMETIHTKKSVTKKMIDAESVAKTVSLWTGIPVTNLIDSEKIKILNLENELKGKIIDQTEAVTSISQSIKRSKAGVSNPKRPIGAFIFLGPTGVGKTELARVLAESVFGSEDSLIKIDMSEFMERHNVSRLVGAPPGYVGFEEAGKLTEAVRRRPYSLILLDEIEKAHPEVFNILLQILEDGQLTDAKGRKVNFRNTIIIMTSNIGMQELSKQAALGFQAQTNNEIELANTKYEVMKEKILEKLKDAFKPELINRLDKIIVFKPLNKESVRKIVDLQISELINRLKLEDINIEVTTIAKDLVAKKGFDAEYGARPVRRAIADLIEDPLSDALLSGSFRKGDIIKVNATNDKIKLDKK